MSDDNDFSSDAPFSSPTEPVKDGEETPTEETVETKPSGGLKFLSVVMFALAIGLLAMPFVWGLKGKKTEGIPDSSLLNDWLLWMGDLHILVLHIPIGIFVYVLSMEVIGLLTFRKFKPHLGAALAINSVSAIVAVVFGYFLFMQGDRGNAPLAFDFQNNTMGMHMWLSILFAVFVIMSFVSKMWSRHHGKFSPFYPLFMLIAAATMTIGAHMGGELVHKDKDIVGDFLILKDGGSLGIAAEDVVVVEDVTAIPAAERLVYDDVVKPILQGKCWECHAEAVDNPLGKKKIKGGLLMTSVEALLMGGKSNDDFPALVPGDSEASEIIVRVQLDKDDDEFMPTGKEEEPELHLTEGEIRILKWWIDSGSAEAGVISEANDVALGTVAGHEAILADVEAFQPIIREPVAVKKEKVPAEEAKVPAEPVKSPRDVLNEAMAPLNESMPGALTFSSQESEELFFTAVSQGPSFSDEQLATLKPVAAALVDLDLKKTSVTDEGLKSIAGMVNLKKLMLNETAVTDAGLETLSVLPNLESLSLFGTEVGDEGLKSLAKVSSLQSLYLSGTKVTAPAVEELRKALPNAQIKFIPPAPPKPEVVPAPKVEEKPKEEPKKPAPAPKTEEKKPEPTVIPAPEAEEPPKPADEQKPVPAPAPVPKGEEKKPEGKPAAPAEEKPAAAPAPKSAEAKKPVVEKKPAPAPTPKVEEKKPEAKPVVPAEKKPAVIPAPKADEAKEKTPAPEPKVEKKKPESKPAPAVEKKPVVIPAPKEAKKPAPKQIPAVEVEKVPPAPKPQPAPKKAAPPALKEAPKVPEEALSDAAEKRAQEALEKLKKAAEGNL